MVVVSGIGWIADGVYGSVFRGLEGSFSGRKDLVSQLAEQGVLHQPLPPLGRYDVASRITCYAVGLCLYDVGNRNKKGASTEIGIMGANDSGCLDANVDYFRDFVSSGRTLGRGNLFIYTLPSSPIAAASIYFTLEGPAFYLSFSKDRTRELLRAGAHVVESGEAEELVAVDACANRGMAFLFKRDTPKEHGLPVEKLTELIRTNPIENSYSSFLQAVTIES